MSGKDLFSRELKGSSYYFFESCFFLREGDYPLGVLVGNSVSIQYSCTLRALVNKVRFGNWARKHLSGLEIVERGRVEAEEKFRKIASYLEELREIW